MYRNKTNVRTNLFRRRQRMRNYVLNDDDDGQFAKKQNGKSSIKEKEI